MNEKLAKIFNIVGVVLMVGLILMCVPFTLPRVFGVQIYKIETGSMEPEYPTGSVIYVSKEDNIEVGDVITYTLGNDTNLVMTHRVVAKDDTTRAYTTKGDANEAEDVEPVGYDRVVGVPSLCIPMLGGFYDIFQSSVGLTVIVAIFLVTLALFMSADRLKKSDLRAVFVAGMAIVVIAGTWMSSMIFGYTGEDSANKKIADRYMTTADDWKNVRIDITGLKSLNSDTVGWLRFDDDTYINYPIVYSGDNEYYLNHNVDKDPVESGAIFVEMNNNTDFNDLHTIVYGHNMRDLSMFGSLKKYKQDGYYEDNQYFTIYLEDRALRYHIFAYRDVAIDDLVYSVGYNSDEQYEEFINELTRKSYINTGVDVKNTDKIVTLSTCSNNATTRFVVHGVLCDEFVY